MCGIAVAFSPRGNQSEKPVEKGLAAIVHRGPDGHATWTAPGRRAVLGHTRLSIIDLVTGGQPIENEDGNVALVVNGELYGFQAIRADLEKRGHRFKTKSDSEIALHLYEQYGAQCVHHLRGEFALAIWDERSQLLFAARDRFGIKPLFWAEHEGKIYLASEAKALFAMGVPARWDAESIAMVTAMNGPDAGRSLFAGVNQVPPGHYLFATASGVRLVPYWDFDYPRADAVDTSVSEEEWIERYRGALEEAVRLRLHADVPVGCYLSGGLDSCTMLGMAARLSSRPVRAFTLGFERAEYDETEVAREMAAKTGSEFTLVPMRAQELVDNFAAAIHHAETIFLNAHGVAKFCLSRAVRDAGYKVVLTGEGSDETLGGYVHFRRDMLLYNTAGQDPAEIERMLEELIRTNQVSRGMLINDGRTAVPAVSDVLGLVPSWLENSSAVSALYRRMVRDDFAAAYLGRDSLRFWLDSLRIREQVIGREPVNQSLYLWSKMVLPNYILCVLGDRMEMAHSVEGRVPFLDHHVVEVARSMPVSMKIRGMTEKYVLRQAARPDITDTVYRRQKHPFLAPPATSSGDNAMHALLQDTLRGAALRRVPFFDAKKVTAFLDELPSLSDNQRAGADPILTAILSLVILQEQFRLSA